MLEKVLHYNLKHPWFLRWQKNPPKSNHIAEKKGSLLLQSCSFFFTGKALLNASVNTLNLINDYMENDLQCALASTGLICEVMSVLS